MLENPGQNIREEFLESTSRASRQGWSIADDYVIKDGIVRAVENGDSIENRMYLPMGRSELPGEFAKLADGSEENILYFVRRYGLLGLGKVDIKGDPVPWIISNAKAVSLVMELSKSLDEPEKLKMIIEGLTVVDENTNHKSLVFPVPKRGHQFAGLVKSNYYNHRGAALIIIKSILDPNLSGVHRTLEFCGNKDGETVLESLFSHGNLLDCIYWMLADAVVSGRIRGCENCGKPFVADNDRRKFCPPSIGEGDVSQCMSRFKSKKYRQRKAK